MAQLNDWLSIDKTSGTGNAEITLTASSYEELVERTQSLVIKGQSENKKVYINVKQSGIVPSATLDSYEITAYKEGTYTNGITSNVPWTAVVNDNWITIDKTQGESGYTPLSITVDAFTETRSGSITFNARSVVLTLQINQIFNLKKTYFWVEFENVGGTISNIDKRYGACKHSFDGITWESTPNTLSMGNNTLVYFKSIQGLIDQYTTIKMNNVKAKIGGDISSLTTDFYGRNIGNCESMFSGNTNLTDASELILPWTTLEEGYGFFNMFEDCTNLVNVPALPATVLTNGCYAYMFKGCTSLVNAPALPATTLADGCYNQMFWGCTSLVNAPELPATTLADSCYQGMFLGCESLTKAPVLPATTLASGCYSSMFEGTSLVNAPALPATVLADSCYTSMFANCRNLVNAPALPATTLGEYCYHLMFGHCTSLVTAPELPATHLKRYCYYAMFAYCTSLVNAPVLPATVLEENCYERMFGDCTSLTYIKMLATDKSASSCLYRWVENVSSTGTFVKHPDAKLSTGISGIPEGWTVETATA